VFYILLGSYSISKRLIRYLAKRQIILHTDIAYTNGTKLCWFNFASFVVPRHVQLSPLVPL
jgi:CRISPR/Cas system-associated endonuclease Cas1